MDLINELNDNLKRAKTLIDEVAQRKINLELNFTSSLYGERRNNEEEWTKKI